MHTTVLISLRGPERSVDLEVPGDIAVGELIPALLEICGPQPLLGALKDRAMWGVGPVDELHPLDASCSLVDADVYDGAELVLKTMEVWVNQRSRSVEDVPDSISPTPSSPGSKMIKDGFLS